MKTICTKKALKEEKRPMGIIFLLFFSFLLLLLLVIFIFYLSYYGITPLTRLPLLLGGILSSIFLVVFLVGILVTILALYGYQPRGFLRFILKLVISRIIPLIMKLGGMVGLNQEGLLGTFIELSNDIRMDEKIKKEQLLILVPHCVQLSTCTFRITYDVDQCGRCGKCQIKDLLLLREKYGFLLKVVNGGTQARQVIKLAAPKGIVAVACERDLSSGIIDTFPLPVYGVINIRPEGPCLNTKIPLSSLEEGIRCFLRSEVT